MWISWICCFNLSILEICQKILLRSDCCIWHLKICTLLNWSWHHLWICHLHWHLKLLRHCLVLWIESLGLRTVRTGLHQWIVKRSLHALHKLHLGPLKLIRIVKWIHSPAHSHLVSRGLVCILVLRKLGSERWGHWWELRHELRLHWCNWT